MTDAEKKIQDINPAQRILLLPHCLRRADICRAKYSKQGLECNECDPDCAIKQLRRMALDRGYKGVCVAPGGRLALKYIQENKPLGIVAIACDKELEEGVRAVNGLTKKEEERLPVLVVPLSRDGCVDTDVDMRLALEKISIGCESPVEGG